MNNLINNFIGLSDGIKPLIFIDNKSSFNVLSLNYADNNLLYQIENLSKAIKRRDFNQIILAKEIIDDEKLIIDITKYFYEEDILVIGIYTDKIEENVLEKLSKVFKYIIVGEKVNTYDDKNKLIYKKTL